LQIWDAESNRLLSDRKRHENSIHRLAVSADSSQIATVSDDLTVRLSSLPPRGDDVVLVGHTSYPLAVAFSGDGRRVVTGCEDGTISIWDVRTGQELISLSEAAEMLKSGDSGVRDIFFDGYRRLLALTFGGVERSSYLIEWRAD
jgi:WD40 repeat protein